MTQEEKQLLLKDLCARLPYGVKIAIHGSGKLTMRNVINSSIGWYVDAEGAPTDFSVDEVKPYLRPMSSMTDEERVEYRKALDKDFTILEDSLIAPIAYRYADGTVVKDRVLFNELDWLSKKMFDYRGLISMGLALEAPEDMYKTSQKWTPLRSGLKENEDGQIVGGVKL